MALRVWLPLNGNLNNLGLSSVSVVNYGASIDTNGKIGSCYSFDGVDDRIVVKDFSLGNVWSYGFGYYSATSSRGGEAVLILNNDGGDPDIQMGMYNYPSGGRAQSSVNGVYNSNISITYGQWNHGFATFDGTTLLTYVNGVLVNTKSVSAAYLPRTHLTIGARCNNTTGGDVGAANFFLGKINDVRVYDEALSPKQIKEISKGLIAHYKLDSPYIEKTSNLAPGIDRTTNFTINNSPAGDTTLNGTPMINPSGGGTGYNGGVTDPTHGYHAHGVRENGQGLMIFPNLNSVIGQKGRGEGISSGVSTKDILAGEKYTISWWQKTDNLSLAAGGGIYYKKTSDGTMNFGDSCPTLGYNTKLNTWQFMYKTFTRSSEYVQHDGGQSIYVYGGNSNEGTMYVKDVQIVRGDHPLPYAVGTRNGQSYESDCSGNGYNGKVNGTLKYNPDSARYSGSTTFDGTTFTDYIGRPQFDFLTGPLTYNCGVYQTSATPTTQFIMSQGRDYGTYGFNLGAVSGVPRMGVGGTSQAIINGTTSLVDNKGHMLTGTGDGVTAKLYVDGAVVGSAAMADIGYAQSSGAFVIGKMSYNYTSSTTYFPFAGSISDAKVYATALSADEILTMYKNSGIIDNKGNVYTYEFIENDNNIFESENIQKYTTNRSSNGYGQIVTRAGEPAIAINPSTFWQTTETQKGIILRDEIIPNQQYYLDLGIDGDDVVYNNNNVSQGIKIRYTDDSSENLTVVGDQTDKKGFQHIQYITPANKSVYSIEQTYYVGIPNYYRGDTIICPLNKVNLTQQGIGNTTNISANSNKAKLHMSGTIYSNDISEI